MTVGFVLGVLLPVTLVVIMATIGVGLRAADVTGVLWRPRVWIGVTLLQFVLLPLFGVALVALLDADPLLALVIVALAAAPGGTFSNVFTFIAGGNLALSVVLTAISTLGAAFLTPALFAFMATRLDLGGPVAGLEPLRIMRDLLALVFLPLLAGALLARVLPALADRLRRVAEPAAAAAMLLLILASLYVSAPALPETLPRMLGAAVLFTLGAAALGCLVALALPAEDRSAVGIEFAVRNVAIPLFLVAGQIPDARTVAYFLSYFVVTSAMMLGASLLLRRSVLRAAA